MTINTFLEVRNITNRYSGKTLLQDVSFTLDRGEILCLLGPSGSGKTTLLRILAGLEQKESGAIFHKGRDLQPVASHKRKIGMMFQEYALFPHKTVWQNIAFGLEMKQCEKAKISEKVEELLILVGLKGFGGRKIDQLSGGERQRVALARSLAPEPELLLLDEPLGSLDRTLRDRLTAEIRHILKSIGVTAIFVTHDQAEAFSVADKVAILKDGVLQQYDSPENVYRNPANRVVAEFLGFQNLIAIASEKSPHLAKLLSPVVGQQVQVSQPVFLIRPDAAKLFGKEEPASKGWVVINGKVQHSRFQGANYRLEVRIENELLRFELPIDPAPPGVGYDIKLSLNPSAIKLLASS